MSDAQLRSDTGTEIPRRVDMMLGAIVIPVADAALIASTVTRAGGSTSSSLVATSG